MVLLSDGGQLRHATFLTFTKHGTIRTCTLSRLRTAAAQRNGGAIDLHLCPWRPKGRAAAPAFPGARSKGHDTCVLVGVGSKKPVASA